MHKLDEITKDLEKIRDEIKAEYEEKVEVFKMFGDLSPAIKDEVRSIVKNETVLPKDLQKIIRRKAKEKKD